MNRYSSLFFAFLLCCLSGPVKAQYFFKDILNTQKLNKEFAVLKKANIKFVKISSFEDDDEPSQGFFCEKKVNNAFSQSEMVSRSYITEETVLKTDYDAAGRVIKTISTTPTITNSTTFSYDAQGNLENITTSTANDRDSDVVTESHTYSYKDGLPEKMVLKKNGTVVQNVNFIRDDKGNIIEENVDGGQIDKKFYYYYDDKGRLTDIVRYNQVAKRLLPDYMFEYGQGSLPSIMTTVEEGGSNYFIWRYAYSDLQLPEIEKCYSREKRLLGTIQYDYK